MEAWVVFLVYLTIEVSDAVQIRDPLVLTNVGLIQGFHADDGNYTMFTGIPYAQVDPRNPFGAHIPQPPFDEVFKATKEMALCPQLGEFDFTVSGTLDCLQISVYVPDTSRKNLLPVMVWIHGGAFANGYGGRTALGPSYIIKHDVILVTINYRLNAYGFMCLDIPEVPGNQGLRDQEAALNWIKNNIKAFGGNDNLITVMGESAGAISVDLHLRYGKGNQFNKVIMQSGSASAKWAIKEPDYESAIKIAKVLGFETNDTKEAVNYLSKANTNAIVTAYLNLGIELYPCVEKKFAGRKRFITDYAANVPIPKAKTTSILLGCNNRELMLLFVYQNVAFFENFDLGPSLGQLTNFNFTKPEAVKMVNYVKQFYIGDDKISSADMNSIIDYTSDLSFVYPAKKSIEEYIENGATNVYNYLFSYNGQRNFVKRRLNALNFEGASHADEIGYLFDVSFFNEQPNEADQKIIDRITTLWTNFAKFSDPTPTVTELIPVKWPAVTPEDSYYLDLGSELVVNTSLLHSRMAFWDLFFTIMENKQK